jgi:hypothetical protein
MGQSEKATASISGRAWRGKRPYFCATASRRLVSTPDSRIAAIQRIHSINSSARAMVDGCGDVEAKRLGGLPTDCRPS